MAVIVWATSYIKILFIATALTLLEAESTSDQHNRKILLEGLSVL